MTPWPAILLGGAIIAALAVFAWRWSSPDMAPHRITPAARRILFPFIGDTVSRSTLDAGLRLARAEGATLVPAYIAVVPLDLALAAPVPQQWERAMPLIEAIERRAARLKVPVDARIEVGRTAKHALRHLVAEERFDRLLVPAATRLSEGFSAEDVAWLLEYARGEIVVVRPPNGARSMNDSAVKARPEFGGSKLGS